MKNVLKRSLSVLLAITIIFSSAYVGLSEVDFGSIDLQFNFDFNPFKNLAVKSDAASESDLTFTLSSDGTYYSVTDCSTSASGELVIPATYNGLPVTVIGYEAFRGCTKLTSITIPVGVSYIPMYAFYGCTNLVSVTIPNGVVSIGNYAFQGCSKLVSVTIPNGVPNIGYYAFYGCTSLSSITIPESVISIDNYAFRGCTSLTSIAIPDSVTSIGSYAFESCTSLTSITIPENITSIGNYAFYKCDGIMGVYITNLIAWSSINFGNSYANPLYYAKKLYLKEELVTELVIPDGVTSIGDYAFYYCESVDSITIPDSVINIGNSAFFGTGYYSDSSNWDNNTLYIGDFLISTRFLSDVYEIKPGVKIIAGGAFRFSSSLTSITIPDSVISIGNSAFSDCTSLTSVTIPDSVISIGNKTFEDCTNLTSVIISNSATSVGNYAFSNCTNLTSIIIPDSVTNLGSFAFDGCTSLINLTMGERVTSISNYAFRNCKNLASIIIPSSVTSIGDYAFNGCTGLSSITVPGSVATIGIYAFYGCTTLSSITLLDGVTSVGAYSFRGCTSLKSIELPDSVISLGAYAFWECKNLTSVTIGDGLTHIGGYAFYVCTNLESVTIGESVTNIGSYVFSGCTNLKKVYWNAKNVEDLENTSNIIRNAGTAGTGVEIVFGDTVEHIPANLCYVSDTSYSPKITKVVIGENITNVGLYAFRDCESLEGVYITDLASWCGITWGGANSNPLCYANNLYINGELSTNIIIPESVTSICNYAFYNCTSLTSIEIPDSVTSIGDYAFRYCSSLTSITIPDSVTSIGDYAFQHCSSLTSIEIPDSVTSIGDYAFQYCSSLTSITIPDSVTSIGSRAFSRCKNLEKLYWNAVSVSDFSTSANIFDTAGTAGSGIELVFGDNVEKIPAYLSYTSNSSSSPKITSITIGENVISIGNYAFSDCTALEKVFWNARNARSSNSSKMFNNAGTAGAGIEFVFGDSVESIPAHLSSANSSYTPKITKVVIGSNVTSIGEYAFYDCSELVDVYVSDLVAWCNIDFDDDYANPLYYGDKLYIDGELVTSIEIPEGIKTITSFLFSCENLVNVSIPDSVTMIENYAFFRCTNLTAITIPTEVVRIENSAFSLCESLEKVYWNAKNAVISTTSANVFAGAGTTGCGIEFMFGDTVEKIPAYLFDVYSSSYSPNIVSVIIGDNVTDIGVSAFGDCNKLKYVFYSGSESEWADISIGGNNEPLVRAGVHYNSRGEHYYSNEWTIDVAPTCTEEGSKSHHCVGCGDKKDITFIEALGHSYSTEWTIDVQPTCAENGLKSHHCINCDEKTDITNIDAIGHYFENDVCVKCDITLADVFKGVLKTGILESVHNYANNTNETKTFTASGAEYINVKFSSSTETENSYDKIYLYDGSDVLVGTYTGTALKNQTIKVSGDTVKIKLTSDGSVNKYGYYATCEAYGQLACNNHLHKKLVNKVNVGCSDTGYTGDIVCVVCDTLVKQGENVPALGHTLMGEWIIDSQPDCTNDGSRHQTCSACGDVVTETILALGHNHSTEWTIDIAPTCTEEGSKSHHCTTCGDKADITVITATGHSFEIADALSTHPHTIEYKCSSCEAIKTETPVISDCVECNFTITAIDANSYKLVSFIGTETDVVIPATYNGRAVTTVGNSCFKGNTVITSVEIAEGVTTIGSLAFMNCASLEKVVIPSSITSIGTQAFYGFKGTIYCENGSVAHNYAVANNIKYVLLSIKETENTKIDYENLVIRTSVQNCVDITEILDVSEMAIAVPTASYTYGNLELYGTGTIVSVFDGDLYVGDFTLIVDGDTNGDSICDVLDVFDVERTSNGNAELDGAYALAGDSNSDDIIDTNDYQSIVNKALAF